MGCLIDAGFLKEDRTLTDEAKAAFIRDVKDAIINGTSNSFFPCGEPIPPAEPPRTLEELKLEDEQLYESFHRDVIKGRLEALAKKMDLDPSFALLPIAADPIALAGSFGVSIKPIPFPDGFIPYLTGLLPIKFFLDLLKAGVPDFLLPADLLPELNKLLAIPSLPDIVPDVPVPAPPIPPDLLADIPTPPEALVPPLEIPSPDLPTLDQLEAPEIPQELPPLGTLPVIPVDEFQTIIEKEIAIVQQIPTLLMKLISEVPKLLTKILIPTEMLPYICKIVSESGAFPLEHPANSDERAYNMVLSKWFSYFLYEAMIAKTLGSSKGSAVASIAASEPINLFPPEPEEPTPDTRSMTPGEKVIAAAREVEGLSVGRGNALYTQNLFYIEDLFSKTEKGKYTYEGEFPTVDKVPPGYTKEYLSENPAAAEKYGVTYPQGFKEYAGWLSLNASSCALFVRYCYFRAGANNRFYLSQYGPSTALQGMFAVGAFRNYKWLLPDGSGKVKLNEDLVRISADVGPTPTLDELYLDLSKWYYTIGEDGKLVSSTNVLTPHLKSIDKLAMISPLHLAEMARQNQPLIIEPGDAIFMVQTKAGAEDWGTEHVAVYTGNYPITVKFTPNSEAGAPLSTPIDGIHGGQPDALNRRTPAEMKKAKKPLLSALKTDTKNVVSRDKVIQIVGPRKNDEYITIDVIDDADSPTRYVRMTVAPLYERPYGGDNYLLQPITEGTAKPTAILAGKYDVGYVKTTATGASGNLAPGYFLGRTMQPVSDGPPQSVTGKQTHVGEWKKIYAIFKAKNYLDPIENGDDTDEGNVKAAVAAMKAMDEHPIMKKVLKVVEDKKRAEDLILNVFNYINY